MHVDGKRIQNQSDAIANTLTLSWSAPVGFFGIVDILGSLPGDGRGRSALHRCKAARKGDRAAALRSNDGVAVVACNIACDILTERCAPNKNLQFAQSRTAIMTHYSTVRGKMKQQCRFSLMSLSGSATRDQHQQSRRLPSSDMAHAGRAMVASWFSSSALANTYPTNFCQCSCRRLQP